MKLSDELALQLEVVLRQSDSEESARLYELADEWCARFPVSAASLTPFTKKLMFAILEGAVSPSCFESEDL